MSSPLSKHPKIAAEIQLDPDPDPPPSKSSSPSFLWSSLFADSASANAPSSSPSYLPDGTPVVIASPSVILRASSTWAGHLLCRFLGEPPSPAKFFSDLNQVWGKYGDISVRRFSSGIFLVHVPSPSTRKWILQTGLWSSGTVSFVVSEWSVNSTLASPPKLTSATTVITIREIPPQLWSHEAVARIAGGVAKLIPGTRASLPLSSLGTATIRAIVPLGSPLPPSVLVKDSSGDSVLVSIDYGRLPHLCSLCNSYGHQLHRCPLRQSATKPIPPKSNSKVWKNADLESTPEVNHSPMSQKGNMITEQVTDSLYLPLVKSPSNATVPTAQNMDLDNIVGEGMVLNCSSDPHLDSVSSLKSDVSQQSAGMDKVPELPPLNTPLITSPKQAPEMVAQAKEIDNMVCEDLISDCVFDPPLVPNSSHPLSGESIKIIQSSPQVVPQPMQAPLHASEVAAQASAIVSRACDDLNAKCASDPFPVPNTSPSLSSDTRQQHHSSSKADIQPVQVPICSGTSPILSESMEVYKQLTSSHNDSSSTSITEPAPSSTSFFYPPPVKYALDPKTVHILPSQIQHSSMSMSTTVKKEYNRDKSKDNPNTNSLLRCKTPYHQFKPQGILEKRRKKAQNMLLPDADEEINECIQEYQSEKKETTYYEVLKAHKILRKADHGTIEALET